MQTGGLRCRHVEAPVGVRRRSPSPESCAAYEWTPVRGRPATSRNPGRSAVREWTFLAVTGCVPRDSLTLAAAARSLVEGLDPAAIVLSDPILDGLERASEGVGDVLCGPTLLGEEDGLGAAPESLLRDRLDEGVELSRGMVIVDEHG